MKYTYIVCAAILAFLYSSWFHINQSLSGGDWPYLYKENIAAFHVFKAPFLWLEPYYQVTAKIGVEFLSLSWEITEKLFWFYPFIIISVLSSFIFTKSILKSKIPDTYLNLLSSIGSVLFVTNTYILMVVGGGQMGVAIAYAFAPLVLYSFFEGGSKKRNFLLMVVVSSLQLMFDPRIWLLTIFIVFLYFAFMYIHKKKIESLKKNISVIFISLVLNLFWILPNVFSYSKEYSSVKETSDVGFLSVASFSNSISLLHPNWPENLFGKVYFMRPEFLLVPLIAFLWIISKKTNNKTILFFSLLALLGSFLAKGTQPPFGEVYKWLYSIPGFTLYRDSTKWYLLVIVSYIILIPYSLAIATEAMSSLVSKKNYKLANYSILVSTIVFLGLWIWLLLPAFEYRLQGTFKPKTVSNVYLDYKNFLTSSSDSFATLWIPRSQRFIFRSKTNPAIDAADFFGNSNEKEIISLLQKKETILKMQKNNIQYIGVPFDSEKEIFLKDYVFSETERVRLVSLLDTIPWLKKLDLFGGKITMYQVKSEN